MKTNEVMQNTNVDAKEVMEVKEKIKNIAKKNIYEALEIYADTSRSGVFNEEVNTICQNGKGIDKLVEGWFENKGWLVEILSHHKDWNWETLSIEINGEIPKVVSECEYGNMISWMCNFMRTGMGYIKFENLPCVMSCLWACTPVSSNGNIDIFKETYPNLYHEGQKLSRRLMKYCKEIGANELAGFEQIYAKFSDMLSEKKDKRHIYISVNPADILTSSNPSEVDDRMLTSCHSLDNDEHAYRCGNSGYCVDHNTIIVFATKEDDEKSRYTRKTDRQLFMINPDTIVQSRLYSTSGGIDNVDEKHKFFRNMVQEVMSTCQNKPNKWLFKNLKNAYSVMSKSDEYGGYPDWAYEDFNPFISHRVDTEIEKFTNIGGTSTCLACGKKVYEGIVCHSCLEATECDCCGERVPADELTDVNDEYGNVISVCESCVENYIECEHCGERCHRNNIYEVEGGRCVCNFCFENYYDYCDECDDYHNRDNLVILKDTGRVVCRDCADDLGYAFYQSRYDANTQYPIFAKVEEEEN